jgi:hypothetical protein
MFDKMHCALKTLIEFWNLKRNVAYITPQNTVFTIKETLPHFCYAGTLIFIFLKIESEVNAQTDFAHRTLSFISRLFLFHKAISSFKAGHLTCLVVGPNVRNILFEHCSAF